MSMTSRFFARAILVSFVGIVTSVANGVEPPAPRLIKQIDVKDFGSEQIRIGDLDGDGGPDFLIAQSQPPTRSITCLTAVTIDGKVLWQVGTPDPDHGWIYSDLPLQIYDWDHDGRNEALYVRQAKYLDEWDGKSSRQRSSKYEDDASMVILDGATGEEKGILPIPAPADDSFLFADLTGRGRREDLVVKDRYWNVWGISHEGGTLWNFTGSTGHYPAIADLDKDGRDEVFLGFTLLKSDGTVLWSIDPNRKWAPHRRTVNGDGKVNWTYDAADPGKKYSGRTPIHSDAECILRRADGDHRLIFCNHGAHCMTMDGTDLWKDAPFIDTQHVITGRFRRDSELQVFVIERFPDQELKKNNRNAAAASVHLVNLEGKPYWTKPQAAGDWMVGGTAVNWHGSGSPENILIYGRTQGQAAQMFDGEGALVTEFPMQFLHELSEEELAQDDPYRNVKNFYPLTADVWGDSREEVILFGSRGLCVYTNPQPLELPTLYNETLYPGR